MIQVRSNCVPCVSKSVVECKQRNGEEIEPGVGAISFVPCGQPAPLRLSAVIATIANIANRANG